MEKTTMLGKLLQQVYAERKLSRDRAIAGLWKRNGLNPNATGYKIAETATVRSDGSEVVEYRLYKMIDCSTTTIKADIAASVATGLGASTEGKVRVATNRE